MSSLSIAWLPRDLGALTSCCIEESTVVHMIVVALRAPVDRQYSIRVISSQDPQLLPEPSTCVSRHQGINFPSLVRTKIQEAESAEAASDNIQGPESGSHIPICRILLPADDGLCR